ncbi:MAG: hypothetical protein OEU97_04920 [Dehalococcoidia bacterium]|nr:hypothetical protein [Dehalococcoidia bacterium]
MARVGIFLTVLALIAGTVGCDGNGSQNLEIRTWHDLAAISGNLNGDYTLMNDLDSTTPGYQNLAGPTANGGKGWQPIGDLIDGFTGSLDGQGFEIKDLFINRPSGSCVGLFGCANGTVKSVGVMNANVTGYWQVGIMVGINEGTVSNSYSTGTVGGDSFVGGLVGWNEKSTLSNSYSTGNVAGDAYVGGLVGTNGGSVSNSYSTGNVGGDTDVGGLVGSNLGNVTECHATGSVIGNWNVGGLAGRNQDTVSNSYSIGNVTGTYNYGGLVGYGVYGTVTNSFWDTETSGQPTSYGGTGLNTTQMHDFITFSGAGWDIIGVLNPSIRNLSYIWNMVNNVTYPFLSWEP